jgi:WD40 repeat protein
VVIALFLVVAAARAQYKDALWVRGGNESAVNQILFTPNSKYIGSTTGDGVIKVWDVATGKLIRVIVSDALSISFTPGGDTVASGERDGTIRLWRVSTGAMIRSFNAHDLQVNSVAYAPGGRYLASGSSDNKVKWWDTYSGTLVKTFNGHSSVVNKVAVSSDGTLIASASDDFTVRLWNIASGDTLRTFKWREHVERDVVFSQDGKYIGVPAGNCFGSGNGCGMIIFETATGKYFRRYIDSTHSGLHTLEVLTVAYSYDGTFAASGGKDKNVYLYRTGFDSVNYVKPPVIRMNAAVNSIVFSPDGLYLAAGGDDKTIRLRNLATGDTTTLVDAASDVHAVAISSTGSEILSGDNFGKVWARNTSSGNLIRLVRTSTQPVQSLAFSPSDINQFASAGVDGRIKRWKIVEGTRIDSMPVGGTSSSMESIAYSSDGGYILSGQALPDTGVKLWNVSSKLVTSTFNGNTGGVAAVAFSPDGLYVASGGLDNSLRVWDRSNGTLKLVLTDHTSQINSIAFSPDGKYLASASDDKTIRVYNFPAGTPVTTFKGHGDNVTGVAFTSDSKFVVSSSKDMTLKVWKISTEENVYTYSEYPSPQWGVAVSGNYVVSTTADGSTIVWNLKTGGSSDLSAPVLALPADASTGQPTVATVYWHPVAGASSYTVEVSTDPTFATTVFSEANITDTLKAVGTLATNTKFYWRVKAQGGSGSSPWSTVWSFTTNNGGPIAPMLSSPADKSTNVPPASVTLHWKPVPGATSYKLEVAMTASFSSGVTPATIPAAAPDTGYSYTLTALQPGVTYYWHVAGRNTVGLGSYSPTWSFATQPPGASVEEPSTLSNGGYSLSDIVPNPLTNRAKVDFVVPARTHARLSIVDERGDQVAVLLDRAVEAGTHSADLDASGLSAGTYFVHFEAGGVSLARKIVVVK